MGEEDPERGQEWHDINQVPTGTEVKSFGKNKQGSIMPIRGQGGVELLITKTGKKYPQGTEVLVDDGTKKEIHIISPNYSQGSGIIYRAVKA